MNQSPDVLTCLIGFAMLNLTSISLRSSTSQLSLVIVKLPEMMWLRSTADPVIMFDHSECGNSGAHDELMSDNLVNFESQVNALSSLRVAMWVDVSLVFLWPRAYTLLHHRFHRVDPRS